MEAAVQTPCGMASSDRNRWLIELAEAERGPRVLTPEKDPAKLPSEREQCVICDRRTYLWLQPENAPLCGQDCLDIYLQDPAVWDPRDLHSRPAPRVVTDRGKRVGDPPKIKRKTHRRKKPGRWEPDDSYIQAAQDRIAKKRRGDDE